MHIGQAREGAEHCSYVILGGQALRLGQAMELIAAARTGYGPSAASRTG